MTYSAQGSDVVMTMVDGRILYENGEFLTLDADRILHDARACVGAAVPLRDGAAGIGLNAVYVPFANEYSKRFEAYC